MKRWIVNNLNSIWLNLITIVYGVVLILSNPHITLIEPPLRYALIAACLVLPIALLIVMYRQHSKARGWLIIALAVLWWWIAWLYFVNPVNNSGWILAISNVGHAFILLFRGKFDGNE
jgi:predicted MFS family arabinose efflux permease